MNTSLSHLLAIALLGVVSISDAASQQTVTGRVTDARTLAPLAGALVSVEGSSRATLTGRDGRYSVQAPADGTLTFSILGYGQRREPVRNRSVVDVAMEAREEIVAVGYGQQGQVAVRGVVSHRPEPPSRSTVTLRFQLIEADGFSERDPAIADVEAALRSLFRFTGYRLLGQSAMSNLIPLSVPRRSLESGSDYQVAQRVNAGGAEYGIMADVGPISRSEAGTAAVDLNVLLYRDRPNGGHTEVLLRTSVRVPDGQTVVLGSAPGAPGENTIILAVRPQVDQ